MADRSNDERLREIIEGTYIGFDEGAAIAAKLLAAQVHRDRLAATLVDVQRELLAARAEVERLQGIIDDIEVESGHCHFLDDAEHEPPHLPDHVRAIVQERDAARADRDILLRIIGDSFLSLHIPHSSLAFDGRNLTPHAEESARTSEIYRAQLQADDQRAWEALGRPEGTYDTTNVQRLCAEVERLRADLREAMELLMAHGEPPKWMREERLCGWNRRYYALLAKHKETP